MSDKEVTTRIMEDDREILNGLSQKFGMKSSVILGHIIKQATEYNMLNQGWEQELAEKELQDILSDMDLDFRKKIELKKVQAQINAKMLVFKEWMKTLQPTEKKQFLENVLGDVRGGDFLERLTNYQMFMIDGQKRLYPMNDRGYPVVAFVDENDLIKCPRGYHIVNNRCNCRNWDGCDQGRGQYENWLAENGTTSEKNRYLEETSRSRRRY